MLAAEIQHNDPRPALVPGARVSQDLLVVGVEGVEIAMDEGVFVRFPIREASLPELPYR